MRFPVLPCRVLVSATLVASGMFACRQIVGIEDREGAAGAIGVAGSGGAAGTAGTGGSPGTGGSSLCQDVAVPPGACGECTRANCCEEALQCRNEAWCWQVHACLATCGVAEPECRASCMASTPEYGVATVLSACQASKCQAQCATSCGGWVYRLDGCGACAEAKCCDKELSCASEPACRAVEKCVQLCSPADFACFLDCNTADPDAASMDGTAYMCMFNMCAGACGMGSVWSCIGNLQSPRTDHTSFDYTAYASSVQGDPLAGIKVQACTGKIGSCSVVLGESTTGSDGLATIPIQIGKAGSFGGWFELSAPDRIPVIAQHVPNLTSAPPVYAFYMFTTSDVAELSALMKVDVDMSLGAAMVYLLDCGTAPARGVIVDPPTPGASVFYADQGKIGGGVSSTDQWGLATIVNVNPGIVTLSVRKPLTGELLMQGILEIRAGTMTYATLAPH